jgi:hypothetical protein
VFVLSAAGTLAVLAAGGAAYLRVAKRPSVIEGAAFAWVGGWGGVNLVLVIANQALGASLTGALAAAVSAGAALAALSLLWPVRSRLAPWRTGLLRRARHAAGVLRREPALGAAAALIAFFAVFGLFKAMSLPVMNTDGLAYHAVIPRDAFRTGSLPMDAGPAWTEWARAFPDLFETQQLWLYLLDGSTNDLWARPLVPVSFILLGLLVAQQARRHSGSRLAAAVAPLLLLSLPELPIWTTQFFVEVPVALAVLCGAALLLSGLEEDNRGQLVLAGIALGSAALIKYNGFVMGAVMAVCGAFMLRRRPGSALLFIAAWAIPAAIILGRNQLLFGNPIYPFFREVLGGRNLELLGIFPAYSGPDFAKARVYEALELLSALPFVIGLPAVLSRPLRGAPAAWKLFVSASVLYFLAYLFFQFRGSHIRYMFPAFPMLAIAGAWLVSEAARGDRRSMLVAGGALLASGASLAVILFLVPGVYGDRHSRWVAISFLLLASAIGPMFAVLHFLARREVARPVPSVTDSKGPSTGLIASRPGRAATARRALAAGMALMLFLPSFPTLLVVGYPGEERDDSEMAAGLSAPSFEQAMARRFGDDWRMWEWVDRELPANATIVTFDPRIYYIEREVLAATSYRMLGTYNVPLEKAVEHARAEGATHILDSQWPKNVEVIRPFYERSVLFHNLDNGTFFRLLHAEGEVRLYEIIGGGAGG